MKHLFTAPIPVHLSFDDIIMIVTALDHHRSIFELCQDDSVAAEYDSLINRLESAAGPVLAIMAKASTNDHADSCIQQ